MFLKTHRRTKNGKDHCYYSIVESKRTLRGVVQRQVLYLGEINDSQREAWQRAIRVFDEEQQTEREVALYAAAGSLPSHAEGSGVRVRLEAMELHRPRNSGSNSISTPSGGPDSAAAAKARTGAKCSRS
jgi:hypothetical protein